jgi:hypothetical protein
LPKREGKGCYLFPSIGKPAAHPEHLFQLTTTAEWREIGREFSVTDILTPADWRLSLPAAAEGEGMVLYEIPAE